MTESTTVDQTATTTQTTAQATKPVVSDSAQKAIDDYRAEAAAQRVAKKAAEEAAERLKVDLEKARAETESRIKETEANYATKLQKQQERIKTSELRAAAVASGLRDLDLLPLIKTDGISIDDDGNVTGIEEAIKAFKESKPIYFADSSSSTSTTTSTSTTGSKKPTPSADAVPPKVDVRKLDKKEYEAAKRAALSKLRA